MFVNVFDCYQFHFVYKFYFLYFCFQIVPLDEVMDIMMDEEMDFHLEAMTSNPEAVVFF